MDNLDSSAKLNAGALTPLNDADVRTLVQHPDPAKRATAAQRICRTVRESNLNETDRIRVNKILAHIADDVAAMVRRALAITLKNSPELPHEIAQKLIMDIDNIAVPLIEHSPVLTDEDLIEVLKSKAAAKVIAVARRPSVSGSIVRSIIRFGDSYAVAEVAANDRAQLNEQGYAEILELAASDDLIQESLIKRRELPPRVVETLLSYASSDIAVRLMARHEIPAQTAIRLASATQERAIIEFMGYNWQAKDLKAVATQMHEEGRLTPSVIVRAAACGKMRFTQHALAVRAGISAAKASLMIHEPGAFGLTALGERARIPALDMHILRGAVSIFRDLECAAIDYDRPYFLRLMIERVLSLPVQFSDDDGDYLLEKLDGLGSLEFDG